MDNPKFRAGKVELVGLRAVSEFDLTYRSIVDKTGMAGRGLGRNMIVTR